MANTTTLRRLKMVRNALEQTDLDDHRLLYALKVLKNRSHGLLGVDARKLAKDNEHLKKIFAAGTDYAEIIENATADELAAIHSYKSDVVALYNDEISQLEKQDLDVSEFDKNVSLLCDELHFDDCERDIILFLSDIYSMETIVDMFRQDSAGGDEYFELFSIFTGHDEDVLRAKLSKDAALRASEIVNYNPVGSYGSGSGDATKSDAYMLDKDISSKLKEPAASGKEILSKFLGREIPFERPIEAWSYVPNFTEHWAPTVAGSILNEEGKGQVFLLHGTHGTGKTTCMPSIAKMAADVSDKDIAAYLIEANLTDNDKPDANVDARMVMLRRAKRADFFLRHLGIPALLVIDDSENLINNTNDKDNPRKDGKSETNETFDGLCTTTVIIVNEVNNIDLAYFSRLCPPFEMKKPPHDYAFDMAVEKIETYSGQKASYTEEQAERLKGLVAGESPRVIDKAVLRALDKQKISPNANLIDDIVLNLDLVKEARNGASIAPTFKTAVEIDPTLWQTYCPNADSMELISTVKSHLDDGNELSGYMLHLGGQSGMGRKSYAEYFAGQLGLKTATASYGQFLGGMSGKEFQSRAFARFVDDANVSRQAIVISGANEIMGSGAPEHHPFFQHLMGYDLPVFVTTTDPVKFEQPAPSTEDAMHNAGAAKQFLKSQFSSLVTNAVETAMGNVQQSLQQMGLPIGEGAANYQKSLPLFAHSIQFVPFVTPEAKNYAFERALGVSGDDQALMHSVPTMTIRDLIMAKHRGSKIIGFEPSAMKYAMLLNKNGTNVPASAFVEPKLAKV